MKIIGPALSGLLLVFLVAVPSAFAQERSYSFDAIDFSIVVNADSTVSIEETQTYDFRGQYHVGWRSIPLKGVSGISDITVIDGESRVPLTYSSSRLDKNDPASWGRYATFLEHGNQNIEWYYDLSDTNHSWILRYKVHGAIAFYKDHDELYWNLFTDYVVPVESVRGALVLPKKVPAVTDLTSTVYVDAPGQRLESGTFDADQKFVFSAGNFPPQGKLTIAVGWSKGVVLYSSYIKDVIRFLWGWWVGAILIFLAFLWVFYIQRVVPKRLRRGTIIPQYEPPEDLPPAQAELLMTESLSGRTWPATIIDLAIRGHLMITEERKFSLRQLVTNVAVLLAFGAITVPFFAVMLPVLFDAAFAYPLFFLFPVSFVVLMALLIQIWRSKPGFFSSSYILNPKTPPAGAAPLRPYEKEFLDALFTDGAFSTLQMRFDQEKSRIFGAKLRQLAVSLRQETDVETKAFASSLTKWVSARTMIAGGIIFLLSVLWGSATASLIFINIASSQVGVAFSLSLVASVVALLGWFNPRLNKRGELLKEDWLGFKLYLETAERYRMQNLTPDLFEKYLPYAMVFGIEKKWAKAFEGITMSPPSWYASGTMVGAGTISHSGSPAAFSPGVFASGFSASFASSFASSGGGGASGGGGGAGGGGGGGGGGAG